MNLYFQYKHSVYVQTCKLFADLERLRIEREAKDMHERYGNSHMIFIALLIAECH